MHNKELKTDRILLTIGIVLYAAWGFIYKVSLPDAIDPFYIRAIGVGIMLLVLGLSFVNSFVQRNFSYFLYVIIYLATLQQCYLVVLNNFASEFLLLFVVLIVTLNAYFKKQSHLICYALFSVATIVSSYFLPTTHPIVSFNFFISSVISIDLLVIPIFISRLRTIERLAEKMEEVERSKEELQKKSDELTRSNKELQQFAYVASHDLQEPLRMVTSYVQLLEDRYKSKLDQDAREFIEFAVDGTNRMRNLIQSLLEYSRVNKTKPFEQIDLNILLDGVLLEMNTQIQEVGAAIKVDKLPSIKGDSAQISQLFKSLISNAIKFRQVGQELNITISGKKIENGCLFSVKDNGIGIAKDYFEKIFVIFQRLHGKDKYPGAGMGLAICKKIVEQHGGKIWVESELNQGSTFYFIIK